ncbi:sialidase family protein [Prevotella heparinolytica]|uniref:sialidase family protein n=1 Tax=Prevotella heparinolytica TaxID=28113 RepID=UPI00163A4EE7|nr:sialidase family protein [Bacteroides heparinolyticus]
MIFSRDFGRHWVQSPCTPDDVICDEALVVEYKKNQVMINSRGGTEYWMERSNNGRRVFISSVKNRNNRNKWEIQSWTLEKKTDGILYDPICNASIIKLPNSIKRGGLFVNPYMPDEYWPRKNLLLRYSRDFKKWKNVGFLTEYGLKIKGYCALAATESTLFFAFVDNGGVIKFCEIDPSILREF